MQKLFFILVFIVAGISFSFAGDTLQLPLKITVFNNGTKLPGGGALGFFTLPVHPGISVGTEFLYNNHEQKQIFQTATLGYFYHQYAQHGIQLYTEFGARYKFENRLSIEARFGVGYLHSIPATDVYKLNDNGEYEKTGQWGRPQFMLPSFTVATGYRMKGTQITIFVGYQFWLQIPFVKQYVPLLPNTALQLGVSIPLTIKKKGIGE